MSAVMNIDACPLNDLSSRSCPISSSRPRWKQICYDIARIIKMVFLALVAFFHIKKLDGQNDRVFYMVPNTQNTTYKATSAKCLFIYIPSTEQAKTYLQNQVKSTAPFLVGWQVGVQKKTMTHSTLLMFGRNRQGALFSLFIDVLGASPSKSKVVGCDLQEYQLYTVHDLYTHFVKDMDSPPALTYSTENSQPDYSFCCAYNAIIWNCLLTQWQNQDDFDHKDFMKTVANGDYTNFWEAYRLVSLADRYKEKKELDAATALPTSSSS